MRITNYRKIKSNRDEKQKLSDESKCSSNSNKIKNYYVIAWYVENISKYNI